MHNLRAAGKPGADWRAGRGRSRLSKHFGWGLPVGERARRRKDPFVSQRPWNSPTEPEGPSPSPAAWSCGLSWAWAPRCGEGLPRRGRGHPFGQTVSANIPAQPWGAPGPAPARRSCGERPPSHVAEGSRARAERQGRQPTHPRHFSPVTASGTRLYPAPWFWWELLC